MRGYHRHLVDDSNSRIGAYEAFLDLLTLLSIVMIFAATIYMAQSAPGARTLVTAEEAVRGQPPRQLPQGQFILIVSRENGIDKLTIVDGKAHTTMKTEITEDKVESVLRAAQPALERSESINFAVFEEREAVNPSIVVATQRWLSSNNFGKYHFSFVGPHE